jgi:hypothetical protein
MKKSQIILAAAFFAASGSIQAAGPIKTYLVEAAFASDDAVEWIGAAPRDENSPQLARASSIATSTTGSVAVRVATGTQRSPNPSSDESGANANSGPLTIIFTSGPVMGVGVRIQANGAGSFTGRMNAYDAAGNLLGTTTIAGSTTSASTDNASPFIGIRSGLKEIAKVEIDASSANGYTINGVKLGLRPLIENERFFVTQLFQDLYGRAPSIAELTVHVNALKQGTSTRAQVAATLLQSAEFHDNAGFLARCYLALMQRDPDFGQWSQILKMLQGGATQNDALTAFMSTPEYAAAYPQGLSDGDFVTRLNRNLLGRDPAPGEMDTWALKLAHGISRRDLVGSVLRSHEFEIRIASRVDTSLAYLAFLRRGSEPAGMNRWADKLNSGASVTDLMSAVITLPEYLARF